MPELLTEKQAAQSLGVSPGFLRKHRATGLGPKWVFLSARCIRYRPEDLDKWVEERIRHSTSDIGLVA